VYLLLFINWPSFTNILGGGATHTYYRHVTVFCGMATMESIGFNYDSPRAKEARLAKRLKSWQILIVTSIILFVLGGAALLFVDEPLGWMVIGLAALPYLLYEWYRHYLKDLPLAKNPQSIDDLLVGDILGSLPKNPSPKDIAAAAGSVNGGLFFGARFGISTAFLQELASNDRAVTPTVGKKRCACARQQKASS
jgi:hypothetical protein